MVAADNDSTLSLSPPGGGMFQLHEFFIPNSSFFIALPVISSGGNIDMHRPSQHQDGLGSREIFASWRNEAQTSLSDHRRQAAGRMFTVSSMSQSPCWLRSLDSPSQSALPGVAITLTASARDDGKREKTVRSEELWHKKGSPRGGAGSLWRLIAKFIMEDSGKYWLTERGPTLKLRIGTTNHGRQLLLGKRIRIWTHELPLSVRPRALLFIAVSF